MRPIDADVAIKELTDRSHEAAKSALDSFWEGIVTARRIVNNLPTIQPVANDTNDGEMQEMKQEFLRMAGYIDVLLNCSDEQKETLLGFISRMSEFMPWTQED